MALKSSNGSVAPVSFSGFLPAVYEYDANTATTTQTNPGFSDGGAFAIWFKVAAWDSANQPILSWALPSGDTRDLPDLNLWTLRRVGSTDAIEIVNTPTSGTAAGPMLMTAISSIAGTGWHQLTVYGFRYAWDGVVHNSGGTYSPAIGQFSNGPTTNYGHGTFVQPGSMGQALTIYPTANVSIGQVGYTIPFTSASQTPEQQIAELQFYATTLFASGPVSTLWQNFQFYAPLDSPHWSSDIEVFGPSTTYYGGNYVATPTVVSSSNTAYVYGPPINAYRSAVCGESSMVAFWPIGSDVVPKSLGIAPYYTINEAYLSGPTTGPSPAPNIEGSTTFGDGGFNPIDIPADASLAFTGPFTVESWVKPAPLSGGGSRTHAGIIVSKRCGSTETSPFFDYVLSLGTTGLITFSVAVGGTEYSVTSSTALTDGVNYLVAGVYDGSHISIFINGTVNGTPVAVSGAVRTSGQNLCIGGPGTSFFDPLGYNGNLASVALYNAALSGTALTAHYTASGAGTSSTHTVDDTSGGGFVPTTFLNEPMTELGAGQNVLHLTYSTWTGDIASFTGSTIGKGLVGTTGVGNDIVSSEYSSSGSAQVSATVYCLTDGGNIYISLGVANASNSHGYFISSANGSGWSLQSYSGGSFTSLASYGAGSPIAAGDHSVSILSVVSGATVTLTVTIDGTTHSPVTISSGAYTDCSHVLIRNYGASSDTVGFQVRNVLGVDPYGSNVPGLYMTKIAFADHASASIVTSGGTTVHTASATTRLNVAATTAAIPKVIAVVSATTSLHLASSSTWLGSAVVPRTYSVSAATTLKASALASVQAFRTFQVIASTPVVLGEDAEAGNLRLVNVSATNTVKLSGAAPVTANRIVRTSALTSLSIYGNLGVAGDRGVSSTTSLTLLPSSARAATLLVSASTPLAVVTTSASGGRVVSVSATTAMGLGTNEESNQILSPTASATIAVSVGASGEIGWNLASVSIRISDKAFASVQLPGGGSVPGGDSNSGLRAVAYPAVSGDFPLSYAETPSGLILMANGVDPMLRWDGLSGVADTAGVRPPSSAIQMGGQDVGTLVGMRYAFCRFVDNRGNYSALSPISNAVNLGRDGLIEGVSIDPTTGVAVIRSTGHGLGDSDTVVFQGVGGTSLNGAGFVVKIDDDHFAVQNPGPTTETWTGGGSWTWGVAEVVYRSVPVPSESKVARRQILRNLDGSADVFYVDIDTTDLVSTTMTSTRSDEQLSASEPVPMTTPDELPYADRYSVPPSHKSILASFAGRIFACGEVAVTAGNVVPVIGSESVRGIGTAWTASLAGRLLYVSGATQAYEIASVDVARQIISLTSPYADLSQAYATYVIRPAPGERRLVYYTEPGLPEAWPPWNSFAIPEVDDELVGMMGRTGFLYFIEKRHIHRFTMQSEPSEGQVFTSVNRGCINGRCFVQVDNVTYLLDEAGIHAFDGGQVSEAISTPIQTLFQADGQLGGLRVDWSADPTLWHASHDPVRDTIRWFVQMEGYDAIYHAISYDYRQRRWWIEQYPTPITSSTTGIVGYRRSLCGTDARRVIALGEGSLDLVADSATGLGGTVTDADSTSLTDSNASFPANLAGAPVSITYGASGRRQQRIIAENTSNTLTIVEPWDVVPDQTCTYQVGGVQWSWRSGWFEQMNDEESNPQDLMLTYQPTTAPTTIDVQVFYDHATDPRDWALTVNQDGVGVLQGDPNITFNLQTRTCRSGWSLQRFGGHSEVYAYGDQYVQVWLGGVQCSESVRVFQITLNGLRPDEDG